MKNIKINEAETIFEPFWNAFRTNDCLSLHNTYHLEDRGVADFHQAWEASVKIHPGQKETDLPVSMERECNLNIQKYDRMKMFAGIDPAMNVRMICCIDGVETEVYNVYGMGDRQEYVAEISGACITKIRIEFRDTSAKGAVAEIVWLGLANSVKEHEMLTEESPYTADWEGFFADEPEIAPQLDLFFDRAELEQIRERIKLPNFAQGMAKLRAEAESKMSIVPENEVGKFVLRPDRRFCRDRDMKRPDLIRAMDVLAFVGLVDENEDMLRMACRMALAVCHCQYFYESEMGVFPGITWHHSCFTEIWVCTHLVSVLDWAGGYLSERGKNLIYHSILRKGLPEIELVMNTQEYIRECNQGPIFASSLITTLAALQKRWPRYGNRLAEVEEDFFQMWQNYVFPDGGSNEGPAYWQYTMGYIISTLYLLARVHNKPLEEYVPDIAVKSGIFATALLSEVNGSFIPINEASVGGQFTDAIIQFLARINAGDVWKMKNNQIVARGLSGMESIIRSRTYEINGDPVIPEFIHLQDTGLTTLKRKTEDLDVVALYAISGSTITGHSHQDKNSFILEANHRALLIDRGKLAYSDTFQKVIGNAEMHNVLVGVANGRFLTMGKIDEDNYATVLKAEYENGKFDYASDSTPAWCGAFESNVRSISSPNPYQYVIKDDAVVGSADSVCFVLNTYGDITQEGDDFVITDSGMKLTITTKDWKPTKVDMGEFGMDGKKLPVNRLCLFAEGAKEYHLTTEIKLSKI